MICDSDGHADFCWFPFCVCCHRLAQLKMHLQSSTDRSPAASNDVPIMVFTLGKKRKFMATPENYPVGHNINFIIRRPLKDTLAGYGTCCTA